MSSFHVVNKSDFNDSHLFIFSVLHHNTSILIFGQIRKQQQQNGSRDRLIVIEKVPSAVVTRCYSNFK